MQFGLFIFVPLSVWWVMIYARGLHEGLENNMYTLIYPLLSLLGGAIGHIVAQKWGGFKSIFGRAISFFSFGLFAQFFGQAMYAYYIYIQNIEVPYPSLGDVGYFGSVIFYILAVLALGKVIAIHTNLKSVSGKLWAFLIPLVGLIISYLFFLKGYVFDFSQPIKLVLDFGYPLGEALYISIAVLILILSRNVLGGMMRNPLRLLIFALVVQYISDFMFLYQANAGTWYVAGINDFLYSVSYMLLTLSLTYIGFMFDKITES